MIHTVAILTPAFICGFWALVFLLSRPSDNKARFFLGFFMLASFLIHVGLIFFLRRDFGTFLLYEPVYNLALYSVFPIFYFFIRLLTFDVEPKLIYLRHLIPAVFLFVFTLLINRTLSWSIYQNGVAGLSDIHFLNDFRKSSGWIFPLYLFVRKIITLFQISVYTLLSIRLFRYHNSRIHTFYSNESAGNINWVKIIFFALIFTSLISFVFAFIGKNRLLESSIYLMTSACIVSLVGFLIGFLGYKQVQVVKEIANSKDEKVAMDPDSLFNDQELKIKLESLFTEKLIYRNPDLSIWNVSDEMNSNRTYISNFINRCYGINFSAFVNQYRVNEAKSILNDINSKKFSLETMGEKCGFGSLNNFIRVFRSFEGITPGKYRKNFNKSESETIPVQREDSSGEG